MSMFVVRGDVGSQEMDAGKWKSTELRRWCYPFSLEGGRQSSPSGVDDLSLFMVSPS